MSQQQLETAVNPTSKWRKEKNRLTCTIRPVPVKQIASCGHGIDPYSFPKDKCPGCWAALFTANKENTQANIGAIHEGDEADVTAINGKRYTKMLKRMMAAMDTLMKMMDQELEAKSAEETVS